MVTDSRVDKFADVLINYSMGIQRNQRVIIQGTTLAEPLLRATYTAVLQAGGHPMLLITLPDQDELLFRFASDNQLQHVSDVHQHAIGTYDAILVILSTANTRALNNVDPARSVLRDRARSKLTETLLSRYSAGELKWTGTLFPTNAFAQDADMSLHDYEDFVYGACMPDPDDPVGWWQRLSRRQQRIVDWLKGRKEVHVRGPETELTLRIDGRSFINCDGHENMPDGEVFTGPLEDSVNGHVFFSYPAIHGGREVSGVRLWFEDGKVVKATAEKNEAFLLKTIDTDEGARRVGEFAIGTNAGIKRFTRQLLFDEKIGGSFHMALGAGIPSTGSKNRSAIHWDMICDLRRGGEIRVDGELLNKDGEFVI